MHSDANESRRSLWALALALLAVALLLGAFERARAQAGAPADGEANRATVVVQFDDTANAVRSVTFTAPISGLVALQATGLDVTVAETDFGPAVCAVEGVGCPADDCFCGGDSFWNYAFWDGGAWQSYPTGASASVISSTGAVEGWRWGEFETTPVPGDQAAAAARALGWLLAQQSPRDGGYGGMAGSAEVMMAAGAAGHSAADWQAPGAPRSLSTHARIHQTRFSRGDAAAAGKLAVAIGAADGCWGPLAVRPTAFYSETLGAFSPDAGFNAWGILGTAAVSKSVPVSAVESLKASALVSGGWEWQTGFGPDSNTTALAIQALIAAGEPVSAGEIVSGLAFLKATQQADGGFAYDVAAQFGSDANSTAYALQALAAAGEDPRGERWLVDGADPVAYLLANQAEDGGVAWQAGGDANLLATAQAVPALLGRPYPISVKEPERCKRGQP